jgi:hypothetical protein
VCFIDVALESGVIVVPTVALPPELAAYYGNS